jgi:flagellin-like hook-associated protein FlgL
MSSISSSFARVPNSLATQITRQNVTSANLALLQAQIGLATQKRVITPSDDPVAASIINVLDQRLETAGQRSRNLSHAASSLGALDSALSEINNALNEAKTIASSQVGVGSDPETRRSQAAVVSSLIDSLVSSLNADFAGLHLLGGNATKGAPIQSLNGGYQYVGQGPGLSTDLGPGLEFPITLGADSAVGALSARVQGDVDLSPVLTDSTFVRDLRGPGGPGAALGSLVVRIDDGSPPPVDITVDLSQAETLGDVSNAIESAIRTTDAGALGGAYPSGVGLNGERLQFAVSAGYQISFIDGANGTTARDLGIDGFVYDNANAVSANANVDLNPQITDRTLLSDLNPTQALAYGDIVFRNGGRQGTITLTPGMSIAELKQAVARLGIGVRLEIGAGGDTINVINEVSGNKLSVEESGSLAATRLGIRSLSGTTPTSVFNDGRGVRIADGQVDPTTGLPDANRNVDFEITLTDGSTFTVDLTAADTGSVSAVLAKINADAVAAGFGGVFSAGLVATGNGIEFQDTSGGAGALSVRSLNGNAAADLGLLEGAFTSGATATLVSTDRAQVRVDSALTALIDLREALLSNDSIGITFAGERIESALEKVIQAQGLVGGRAKRVDDAQVRLEDTKLIDTSIKSNLQDLDYIEATTQFSLLQTQLQAGLQAAAAVSQLSLLNFLG